MLTITKDGKILAQAKDDRSTFAPTFESEKDKKPSLFAYYPEDEKGGQLSDMANRSDTAF